MPLPFLAADGGHDQQVTDTPLPYSAQDKWMRPYRPGPWRVATAALMLMLAAYLLFAGMIIGVAKGLSGAEACLGASVLVIVSALRLLRVGFWVSGRGLRQCRLFSTVTVPWDQVGSVRTAQQPVRVLGLPRTVQGQALIVTRANGQQLRPLMTDHNADFLGRREAFDMAADAIEGRAAELR
ncbi:hypothetical protein [Actinacidiphila oryziradicis]|uniref:hypothetical protein n=1 Tax=Actinacidiphila oryziradicis TaxID=2571141 RepID=UPI0023F3F298|nr:hypothetical protein [Actinacidiphila oryziradicis]MCW2870374.1 hypothetical protein [Actinacidiphila oryziradicis]